MVVSVVEAHVAEEQRKALQDAYAAELHQLRPGIVGTFLVQDLNDPAHWQIMTIWASREALMSGRQPGETPPADRMFQAAGATPTHAVFDVVGHGEA